MPIALVQSKNLDSTGTLTAVGPTWTTPTTAGNLLILAISERASTAGTWPTVPAGYTAVTNTPFVYNSGAGNPYGLFYKIAAGSDATPGNCGESSGTQNWSYCALEFSSPTGWLGSPFDVEAHSAATGTGTTTKASGSTATLAQASELVFGYLALTTAFATFTSFATSGLTAVAPSGATNFFKIGWLEVSATTAVGTTATWTTTSIAGMRVATFKTAASAAAPRPVQRVVRLVRSGA